jgi:hypothetical protein
MVRSQIVHVRVERDEVKGKNPIIWSPTDWTEKTKKLTKLADELRDFQKELKNIKIQIPTELGWLTRWDDSAHIIHRQRNVALMDSGPSWVPGPPSEEPKK